MSEPTQADLLAAANVLARLVRDEFPPHSLVYIAEVWGDATPAELDALRAVEPHLESD